MVKNFTDFSSVWFGEQYFEAYSIDKTKAITYRFLGILWISILVYFWQRIFNAKLFEKWKHFGMETSNVLHAWFLQVFKRLKKDEWSFCRNDVYAFVGQISEIIWTFAMSMCVLNTGKSHNFAKVVPKTGLFLQTDKKSWKRSLTLKVGFENRENLAASFKHTCRKFMWFK